MAYIETDPRYKKIWDLYHKIMDKPSTLFKLSELALLFSFPTTYVDSARYDEIIKLFTEMSER